MIEEKAFLDKKTKSIIWHVVLEYRKKRNSALLKNNIEVEKFRDELREIKERAICNIEELKKKAIENFKSQGVEVLEAKDSKDARNLIEEILKDRKVIVKSKSNTFNEIDSKGFLSDKELVETDLGDFLVQLFDTEEIHPVLPALHLAPETISKKIKEKFGESVLADPRSIASFVRGFLRKKIVLADAGISGANAITADGKIVILENEGNISFVSRFPDIHIVLAGWEKIVENINDAMKVVLASAIWGTGQEFPVYVSIISGPSKTADIQNETVIGAQGAKKLFLILLDNGRSEIVRSDFKEVLYCLNCGACLNFCPVFNQIGRNYGVKYLGSRGIIFAGLTEGAEKAFSGNCFACTLCSACFENCPVRIDLPRLMKGLRNLLTEENVQTKENEEMISKIREFGNPFGKIAKGKIPKKLYCC